jgi:hypothetical protein
MLRWTARIVAHYEPLMKAIVLVLSIALAVILLPIIANPHLRNVYRQTLAHWASKITPPPTVFIGDSITADGGWFDDIRNINLASAGLVTEQIAQRLEQARAYRPKRIVVMAGMNDAFSDFDADRMRRIWEGMCKEPNIVVTLVTPSTRDDANRRIDRLNQIALDGCPGKPILVLDVKDEQGRFKGLILRWMTFI